MFVLHTTPPPLPPNKRSILRVANTLTVSRGYLWTNQSGAPLETWKGVDRRAFKEAKPRGGRHSKGSHGGASTRAEGGEGGGGGGYHGDGEG